LKDAELARRKGKRAAKVRKRLLDGLTTESKKGWWFKRLEDRGRKICPDLKIADDRSAKKIKWNNCRL